MSSKSSGAVFASSIIAILLLGASDFLLPDARASSPEPGFLAYHNPQLEFSMSYPEGWSFEELMMSLDGTDYIVSFYDDPDGWQSYLEVTFTPNYAPIQVGTDQQWLNGLNLGYRQVCESASYEVEGYTCSNHSLIDSRVLHIDGKKSYQLVYSWIETYEDFLAYENISISTIIHDGFNSWHIYSESISDVYPDYRDDIIATINSFDSLKTISESVAASASQSGRNVVFQEDIFTFVDYNQRPLNPFTPKEITDQWYANTKHDFAFKFPHAWRQNWTLDENFQGH